jgi:hypothetical protein
MPVSGIDLKEWLFQGLIIREKDFREKVDQYNWEQHKGEIVHIFCSADAIIPLWAYMLITVKLAPFASWVFAGTESEMLKAWYAKELAKLNAEDFAGKRIVVKGCGDLPVPDEAYLEITRLLLPHVKSIMYGEPCSTVPVYKAKR